MILYSALLVGFLGSFHCAGMCGPIALALPARSNSRLGSIINLLNYNFGRIVTYTTLGVAAGLIGHRIAMAGFQRNLSIASGLIVLLIAFLSIVKPKQLYANRIVTHYANAIKTLFKKLFGSKSPLALFLIGIANGLLPCGFVYLALAAAVSTGNYLHSAGYMALFGLGTLPMMLGITLAGNIIGVRFFSYFRKVSPYVAVFIGLLLIYRGYFVLASNCCHH